MCRRRACFRWTAAATGAPPKRCAVASSRRGETLFFFWCTSFTRQQKTDPVFFFDFKHWRQATQKEGGGKQAEKGQKHTLLEYNGGWCGGFEGMRRDHKRERETAGEQRAGSQTAILVPAKHAPAQRRTELPLRHSTAARSTAAPACSIGRRARRAPPISCTRQTRGRGSAQGPCGRRRATAGCRRPARAGARRPRRWWRSRRPGRRRGAAPRLKAEPRCSLFEARVGFVWFGEAAAVG